MSVSPLKQGHLTDLRLTNPRGSDLRELFLAERVCRK